MGEKMERYTLKQLKSFVDNSCAIDISRYSDDDIFKLKREHNIIKIGYCINKFGCNGLLLQDYDTKILYVVISRVSPLWLF